jgi:hypothetical protein
MNLKELLDMEEMALPSRESFKTPESAAQQIVNIYNMVKKGNVEGDYLGKLQAAMQFIGTTTAPERYAIQVKKGKEAIGMLKRHRAGKAKTVVHHTAVADVRK